LRNLPEVNFTFAEARKNPAVVVERSLRIARDFLDGKVSAATSSLMIASSTTPGAIKNLMSVSRVRIRPWLEDFFHEDDRAAGRPWGVEKVRLQVEGAEKVEQHGWLLWNAANVYTENSLTKVSP
jgi:hypothetical protein